MNVAVFTGRDAGLANGPASGPIAVLRFDRAARRDRVDLIPLTAPGPVASPYRAYMEVAAWGRRGERAGPASAAAPDGAAA